MDRKNLSRKLKKNQYRMVSLVIKITRIVSHILVLKIIQAKRVLSIKVQMHKLKQRNLRLNLSGQLSLRKTLEISKTFTKCLVPSVQEHMARLESACTENRKYKELLKSSLKISSVNMKNRGSFLRSIF